MQSHLQDICNAYAEVITVKHVLLQIRSDIEVQHKKWFDYAVTLGENIDASAPSIPRQCKRQIQRANIPADTPEIYYRRVISIPFRDELLAHLNLRFSDSHTKTVRAMEIVPSVIVVNGTAASIKVLTKDTLEVYKDDMPSPSYVELELDLWSCKWINYSELSNMPCKGLVYATESMFPNIHHVLRVICTVPVTLWECERSISVLR